MLETSETVLGIAEMYQKKGVTKQPARIPPPLTFDHMFNIYLNPEFIKNLSGKGKQWLSRAMVNMLVVDKSIHHSELSYLEDAIGMAETEEEREELKKAVKEHNQLELGNLDTDRDYAGHFFYYLAMNVAADGKIKKSEVDYLLQLCGKLGFPPNSAKEVLRWAVELVKLSHEREQMVAGFRHVSPMYAGY